MHWPLSYKILPQKIQLFAKAIEIRNWHLCFSPIVLAWLEKFTWKVFTIDEQWIGRAVLHLLHFILEMNVKELRLSHSTALILCTLQKHTVELFSPPYDWKKGWKMRGLPCRTSKQSILTLCRTTVSVLLYMFWKYIRKVLQAIYTSVLFLFVSNSKALFVLCFWNLTSELLRRKYLHLPFRSCISVPTGRPNRCRILLFNAFSNDSFLKWLKHYL